MIYDMIYLLNAIGLTSCSSSTVHIYTQTVHRTTQNKQYTEQHKTNNTQNNTKQTIHTTTQKVWKRAGRALSLPVIPRRLPDSCGKSTQKPSVRVAEVCRLAA